MIRFRKHYVRDIPISKILLGGENDLPGYQFALMSGDYMRPSTLATHGPHTRFLQDYSKFGIAVLDNLEATGYYKNAQQCIDFFGDYFPGIDSDKKIILAAERFIGLYEKRDVSHLPSEGHSKRGELVELVPVKDSDCYQLRQGNHRLALAAVDGQEFVRARVSATRVEVTPIQFLLESLQWECGEKVLYQPLHCPELELQWILARSCEDRLERMLRFMTSLGLESSSRILDLGSYYGWFVSRFRQNGYAAEGVEKDNTAILIGKMAYGNLDNSIYRDEISRFLGQNRKAYDVTCLLSIMHHLISGREKTDPLKLLDLLDKNTSGILFFEMGQADESWFAQTLAEWTVDTIEKWVLDHTTFKRAVRLGRDDDGRGQFNGNFGRILFAFFR